MLLLENHVVFVINSGYLSPLAIFSDEPVRRWSNQR